jgi:hypothetical protein
MSMSHQTRFMIAKLQGSAGVAAAYAGADLIPCLSLGWTPFEAERQNRQTVDGKGGAKPEYATRLRVRAEAQVEAAGGGAAGTAPFYDALLRACGFAATVTAATSVVYKPVSAPAAQERATLVGGYGGSQAAPGAAGDWLQEVLDAMGTLAFSATEGQLPSFTATLTGIYGAPVARSAIAGSAPLDLGTLAAAGYRETTPISYADTSFSFGGAALKLRELSFSDTGAINYNDRPNDIGTRRGPRLITGRMVVTAPALGTFNYFTSASAGTTHVLDFGHRSTAGEILEIDAPKVQAVLTDLGEDNDEATATFDLRFLPNAGDDELVITIR